MNVEGKQRARDIYLRWVTTVGQYSGSQMRLISNRENASGCYCQNVERRKPAPIMEKKNELDYMD